MMPSVLQRFGVNENKSALVVISSRFRFVFICQVLFEGPSELLNGLFAVQGTGTSGS